MVGWRGSEVCRYRFEIGRALRFPLYFMVILDDDDDDDEVELHMGYVGCGCMGDS